MLKNKHGIDLSAIKPGDTVTFTATATEAFNGTTLTSDGKAVAVLSGLTGRDFYDVNHVTAYTSKPREVKVGTRLRRKGSSGVLCTVLAVDGEDAWLRFVDTGFKTSWKFSSIRADMEFIDP